jgi:hypothetical protein
MGYLNNSTITVDAILTKKGRELLARGRNEFKITQFALADDEVDYDLWNPAHPNGSDYYGVVIENMPITEAIPDETLNLKYKLITLPRNTPVIPVITLGQTSIELTGTGENPTDFAPKTENFLGANETLGYTFIISDNSVCKFGTVTPAPQQVTPTIPRFIGDNEAPQSESRVGVKFKLIGIPSTTADKTTKLTIIGNETGGRIVVDVVVKQLVTA